MQANIDASIADVLDDEGDELNVNPPGTPEGQGEPGGASRYGISLLALAEDNKALGLPVPTVATLRDMSRDEAAVFYLHRSKLIRFNDLPAGIDYVALNTAITIGNTGAALVLQMTLDLWPTTGTFDDATVATLKAADPKIVIHALGSAWLAWKARSGPNSWTKYGHGWTNRDRRVRARALAMLAN